MNTQIKYRTIVAALAMLFSASSMAAAEMPRLQFGHGDVKAISLDGTTRPLKKGDALRPGEKLVTGPGAMAQLRLFKQGVVVLRDDSQLELKPEVNGRYAVALERGLLRTVTRLGYRQGEIDIATPVAQIAVKSGDMLTGVGTDKSARTTTHNHVFDGVVRIRTSNDEKIADVGKVFQINPIGGAITTVKKTPDSMKLTLPPPSRGVKAVLDPSTNKAVRRAFDSDLTKIAVLKPDTQEIGRKVSSKVPRLTPNNPIAGPGKKLGKKVYKVQFDAARVYDPKIDSGLSSDREIINNSLVLEVPNSIRKTRSFTPVLTRDPKIRKDLSKQATVVKLQPTVKTAGETTFSSTRLPIKAVTVNPDKLVKSSSNYNPKLVKTIKSGTVRNPTVKNNGATDPVKTIKNPIRTTTCVKCTKSLLLIRK